MAQDLLHNLIYTFLFPSMLFYYMSRANVQWCRNLLKEKGTRGDPGGPLALLIKLLSRQGVFRTLLSCIRCVDSLCIDVANQQSRKK